MVVLPWAVAVYIHFVFRLTVNTIWKIRSEIFLRVFTKLAKIIYHIPLDSAIVTKYEGIRTKSIKSLSLAITVGCEAVGGKQTPWLSWRWAQTNRGSCSYSWRSALVSEALSFSLASYDIHMIPTRLYEFICDYVYRVGRDVVGRWVGWKVQEDGWKWKWIFGIRKFSW